jgi:hypothetical protein
MFLNNYRKVIKETKEYNYVLYVSDKGECKAISNGNSPSETHEIIAHGESSTMDNPLAKILLPTPIFIRNYLNERMCDSYKCWACEALGTDQMISHIEAINGWECLMNVIGNPEWVVITKEFNYENSTI